MLIGQQIYDSMSLVTSAFEPGGLETTFLAGKITETPSNIMKSSLARPRKVHRVESAPF